MTTQHTSDHEQPDHDLRVEMEMSIDSQPPNGNPSQNSKNWDKKTRRRHSVSSAEPSQDNAPVQTENDASAGNPLSADSTVEVAPAEEPEPDPEPEPELAPEPEPELAPEPEPEVEPEPAPEPEPEPEPALEAESASGLETESEVEPEPEPEAKEPQAEESLAPSTKLFEDDFDDEFYDSLEVSAPWSNDAFEQLREEAVEGLVEEQPREEVAEGLVEEQPIEEVAEDPIENQIQEEQIQEQTVENAIEEIEESADAIEDSADDLEDFISDLDEVIEDRPPKSARKPAKAKPAKRKQPKPEPAKQPTQTKQPTKRKKPAAKPADQEAPQYQQESRQQGQQQETQSLREKKQPQQRSKQHRSQQPNQQYRDQQQPQRTQRAQKQCQQRYLKSASPKQAFRNLLKLNAGAAWRETRVPIVTFFVLFSLLALAVADALPAVSAFNDAIISAVQSARGVLDTFVITLTTIGDFLPMAGLCLVVCLILYLAKKWDSLAFFIVNVVLAIVCVQALKLVFAVPRPTAETLVPIPQSFSFPSAHSFCSLIVFGMIGLLIYRALVRRGVSDRTAKIPGIALIVFAILVGISRIYVGVHWPSDVLGGWLLAGTWLSYVGALYTAGARQTTTRR